MTIIINLSLRKLIISVVLKINLIYNYTYIYIYVKDYSNIKSLNYKKI